jgi:predicted acyltransferase
MPINKKIWTPSFTVFTAGMAMLTLGAVFYLTDVKGRRAWAWPFKVYGMNAIAAYVFVGVLFKLANIIKFNDPTTHEPVTLWRFWATHVRAAVHGVGEWVAQHASRFPSLPRIDTPGNVDLALPLTLVLVIFVILCVMYAFRIFLKV